MPAALNGTYGTYATYGAEVPEARSPYRPFAVSLLMQGHAGGGRRLRGREFFL
jgi:hypothetical protein